MIKQNESELAILILRHNQLKGQIFSVFYCFPNFQLLVSLHGNMISRMSMISGTNQLSFIELSTPLSRYNHFTKQIKLMGIEKFDTACITFINNARDSLSVLQNRETACKFAQRIVCLKSGSVISYRQVSQAQSFANGNATR